jgi:hypothetical protein
MFATYFINARYFILSACDTVLAKNNFLRRKHYCFVLDEFIAQPHGFYVTKHA